VQRIFVWDIGLRLFHWLLVGCVVFSYISIEWRDEVIHHAYSGWAICTLLIFRFLWGVIVRPRYASFFHMLRALGSLPGYMGNLARGAAPTWLGHNPLGALSAFTMLLLLTLQILIGLCMSDDVFFEGPLYHLAPAWLTEMAPAIHEQTFHLLLALVVLHLVAIVYYRVVKKQHLVAAMITGRKQLAEDESVADNLGEENYSQGFTLRACVVLILTFVASWYLLAVWIP